MALQIWLPLNGNLNNQGLATFNAATQTYTPVYINNGKIGKAMSTGSFYIPAESVSKFYNNTGMSFCFWIYPTTSGSVSTPIIGRSAMSAGDNRMYTIYQYPNGVDIHLSWQNENSSETFLRDIWYHVLIVNTWNHVTITYNGFTAKLYVNGIYKSSVNGTSGRTNFNYNVPIPNSSSRYLNDIRIYNHCLSPKEVKEISRGLVLHYKLDDTYSEETTNILSYSNLRGHGSSWTLQTETFRDTPIYKNVVTSPSPNIQNNAGFSIKNPITPSNLNTATKVTLSFYKRLNTVYGKNLGGYLRVIKSDSTTETYLWSYNKPNWANDSSSIGIWEFVTATVTIPANCTSISHFYVYTDYATGGDCDFAQIQLEFKDHATPYVNGTRTATTMYDSSGYGNNGNIIGNLNISNDTPRYNYSSLFDATVTNYITVPYQGLQGSYNSKTWTISFWINTQQQGNRHMITGMIGNYNTNIELSTSNTLRIFWAETPNWYPGITCELNTWVHVVVVITSTYIKAYKDGVLIGTNTTAPNWAGCTSNLLIGSDQRIGTFFLGAKLSDFRIYSTELSLDDIKELYNTSAYICNNRTLCGYEFEEEFSTNIIPDYTNVSLITMNGWSGSKEWNLNGYLVLTATNGWRSFGWDTSNYIGQTIYVDFDYQFTDLSNYSSGRGVSCSVLDSVRFNMGKNLDTSSINIWRHFRGEFIADNYFLIFLGGSDDTGKSITINIKNLSILIASNTNSHINKNGVIKSNIFKDGSCSTSISTESINMSNLIEI